MPINSNIKLGGAGAANTHLVQDNPQQAAARNAAAGPVLGGPAVSVTYSGTALDKLVAKVKGESEDARIDAAKRRIAIILTVLSALNIAVNDSQKNNLIKLEALQAQLDDLSGTLSDKMDDLESAQSNLAALDALTASLEAAVERAIKEGELHRRQVAELKETRAADDAELKSAEAARRKDEAAIAAAQGNLDKARENQAVAQQQVDDLNEEIASLKSQIAGLDAQIADCTAAIGDKALSAISAGLRSEAAEVSGAPDHVTAAQREKEEEKEIANNPLRAFRAALDRMDADVRRTIDDNRLLLV